MRTRFLRYRATLTSRAQHMRRNPTVAERKLWFEFLRDLPHKFTRQKPLGRYVADFYCSSAGLVVEVDGDSHYTGSAEVYDRIRTEELQRLRLRLVRFTNEDVIERFEAVCEAIRRAVEVQPQS
jgi:very-short-patch-repair endonuclease